MVEAKLYGVGVGPGDPELLTLKGLRILREVAVVAAPVKQAGEDSSAWNIVRSHLGADARCLELEMPMSRDRSRLENSWDAAAAVVGAHLAAGRSVAFVTLGDPTLYSTYMYLHNRVIARGFAAEIVPGVTAMCAISARLGCSLAEGSDSLAILPSLHSGADFATVLDQFDNVVVMKAGMDYAGLEDGLRQRNLLGRSALVSNCGMANERVLSSLAEGIGETEMGYFTTVLIKQGEGR